MRMSTFGFLALFLAMFGVFERRSAVSDRRPSTLIRIQPSTASAGSPRVQELERELARLERRYGETTRSLRELDGTLRTMQDLTDRAARNARRAGADPSARSIHERNVAETRRSLEQIRQGRDELEALRDSLDVQRTAARARIQLARSGIAAEQDQSGVAPDAQRLSPVDALGQTIRKSAIALWR